jgi:hypothetical protein
MVALTKPGLFFGQDHSYDVLAIRAYLALTSFTISPTARKDLTIRNGR